MLYFKAKWIILQELNMNERIICPATGEPCTANCNKPTECFIDETVDNNLKKVKDLVNGIAIEAVNNERVIGIGTSPRLHLADKIAKAIKKRFGR